MDFASFLSQLKPQTEETGVGSTADSEVGQSPADAPGAVSAAGSGLQSLASRESIRSAQSLEQRLAGGANSSASDAIAAAAASGGPLAPKVSTIVPQGRQLSREPALTVDFDVQVAGEAQPPLEGSTITRYATEGTDERRKLIAVNNNFISYGLNTGHIRVLNRHSPSRALLKGHTSPLSDLRFFSDSVDVLGTCSKDGRVIVWHIQPSGEEELSSTQLISLVLWDGTGPISGAELAWHPHWEEVFAVSAGHHVLVCSIAAAAESGPGDIICNTAQPPPGTAILPGPSSAAVRSVAFSANGLFLAAGTADGKVCITETASLAKLSSWPLVAEIEAFGEEQAVGSLLWVASGSQPTILVGDATNSTLQLWQLLGASGGMHLLQTVTLQASSGFQNHIALDATNGIVVLANARGTVLYSLHLSPTRDSFDYVASFAVTMPILSLEAKAPAADSPQSETAPIQVFTVQTQAIQQYSLVPAQCRPASTLPDAASQAPSQEGLPGTSQAPPHTVVVSKSLLSSSSPLGVSGNGTGLAHIAAAPPPLPCHQPQLLTPSQLMQAARANLSRSTSGASSMDADAQHRPLAGSSSFPVRHMGFQATTPPSMGQAASSTIAEEPEKAPPSGPPTILKRPIANGEGSSTGVPPNSASEASSSSHPAPVAEAPEDGEIVSLPHTEDVPAPLPSAAIEPAPSPSVAVSEPLSGHHEIAQQEVRSETTASGAEAGSDLARVMETVLERMNAHQKKLLQQLSQSQQQTVRALREEVKKETKRLETATEAQVAKLVKSQLKTIAEERKMLVAEERANIEKLLVAISSSVNRDLPKRIEEILRREVSVVTADLRQAFGPAVQAALAEALPRELAGGALQGSLEKALTSQLRGALTKPVQEGFRTSFQQQLVPAFEGACQSMFSQVQATFAGGLAEHLQAAGGANAAVTQSLRDSVAQANAVASTLSKEITQGYRQLMELATHQGSVGGRPAALPLATIPDPKRELAQLLEEHRYEEAFSKALDLSNISIVAWLCSQVSSPSSLLNTSPPQLSQGVLLALIQQLGFDLSQDTSTKISWIQDIALVLDPEDQLLAPHMSAVLQPLLANLNQHHFEGQDAKAVRIATAVIQSTITRCQ